MKTISNYFKRVSALFLVCITISFSAFSSYASVPVQASGILEVSIISSLIEAVMASMGLSFSSTTDLNSVVTGLDDIMVHNPDFSYGGVRVFEKIRETLYSAKLGATVALPYACINWLSDWLYDMAVETKSEASDVVHQAPSLSVPGAQVIYGEFSVDFFMNNRLFYGLPVHVNGSNDLTIKGNEPIFLDSCPFVVAMYNIDDGTYNIAYPRADIITYPQYLSVPTVLGKSDKMLIDSVFELYKFDGSDAPFSYCFLKGGDTDFKISGTWNYYWGYDTINDTKYYYMQFYSSGGVGSLNGFSDYHLLPASSTNSVTRIFINTNCDFRFYDSYEQYDIEKRSNIYAPISTVYGSSSVSKELEKDESAGTVYLQLTEAQLTETVENAVADAIAKNPSITEEELNEMVTEQIGALEGVKDAVGDLEDSVENNTEVLTSLSSIMTAIHETVKDISSAVNSFFVIDTAAIDTALAGFDTVWEEKVPFGGAITDMFNNFSFSEDYYYPVISMKTPDILKSFYAEDLIILCDFANYAAYCVWARNLVRALLWFSFGFSVVNHLKTNFNVG